MEPIDSGYHDSSKTNNQNHFTLADNILQNTHKKMTIIIKKLQILVS